MEVDRYKNAGESQMKLQYSQPLAITDGESERKKHTTSKIKDKIDAVLN